MNGQRSVVLHKALILGIVTGLLWTVLTMVSVSVASAADLTASSGSPKVTFDDTDGASPAWELLGSGSPPPGPPNRFFLDDLASGTTVFSIAASTSNSSTLTVDAAAGNVGLANNTMFIDRLNGLVGVGTVAPVSPLHVARSDGTAKILAEETDATTAPRNMFELINNGPIGFNMTDSSLAQTWRFAAQTTGFRVSLDGTGGPEMEVGNGGTLQVGPGGVGNLLFDAIGNLTIAGVLTQLSDVNAKEDFTAPNGGSILERLVDLPIAQWRYKKDNTHTHHLGPTAQDFHAAFGLGADDKHISPGDLASVAVVGVKELNKMIEQRDARIAELERRLAAADAREARLQALEAAMSQLIAARPPEKLVAALPR